MFAFIQARMGSTRLPGKMSLILPNNKTLFENVVMKLKRHVTNPTLVTTIKSEDKFLVNLANKLKIPFYCGNELNVLNRFISAAEYFNISDNDFILRICADNPFLSDRIIDETINYCKNNTELDYFSFGFNKTPGIKLHTGIFVEAVKLSALKQIITINNFEYNEHVTLGIYSNPDKFKVKIEEIPFEWKYNFDKIRLTIDDNEDFELCKEIFPLIIDLDFSLQKDILLNNFKWKEIIYKQIKKYEK